MGISSVRGACPLALALLLALLLHGDAAASSQWLEERFENPYSGELGFTTFWARHVAEEYNPWHNRSGANETDPVSAVIAEHMAAVGSTYGFARLWLSGRCPGTGNDGTMSRITRRCYLRELRRLEEELRPRPPLPPPPRESSDEKVRREVLQILMLSPQEVYPWPEVIRNPVIKSRLRWDKAPR